MFIHDPASKYPLQYDRQLRQLARGFRKNPTDAEQTLWQAIRSRKIGYEFRRQHPLHGFVVDFYCYELMLVIEVDGSIHNTTLERDKLKDQVLVSNSYHVMRFSNDLVLNHLPSVIEKIKLQTQTPFPRIGRGQGDGAFRIATDK